MDSQLRRWSGRGADVAITYGVGGESEAVARALELKGIPRCGLQSDQGGSRLLGSMSLFSISTCG